MAYTPGLTDEELRAEPVDVAFAGSAAVSQLSMQETLTLILRELKIMNQYLFEMPRVLNSGEQPPQTDEPAAFRRDETFFQ